MSTLLKRSIAQTPAQRANLLFSEYPLSTTGKVPVIWLITKNFGMLKRTTTFHLCLLNFYSGAPVSEFNMYSHRQIIQS